VLFHFSRTTYIAIFNPVLNKLEKEKIIEFSYIDQVYIGPNLISYRNRSANNFNILTVLNLDLEIIKQVPVASVVGEDESFIYATKNHDNDYIKVLDWSLNTMKRFSLCFTSVCCE